MISVGEIYQRYKRHDDGFLYVQILEIDGDRVRYKGIEDRFMDGRQVLIGDIRFFSEKYNLVEDFVCLNCGEARPCQKWLNVWGSRQWEGIYYFSERCWGCK